MNFAKFFRTPFLQNTSERLLLTFRCNSPIKKNLSDVSTIGCLLFLGNFPSKRLHISRWGCSLFLSTWNLKMSGCYRKHFQLNHIRTSCIFLSRRSRIVITNLFKNTLQRESASMKICLQIMETLNAESSARWCFVEKKILYFRKVFGETTHIGGLFSKRRLQESLQNIRWSTLQQDLTACRC